MNTQTHILLAATLFARPGRENQLANTAVLTGVIVPDALIFVMFVWSKVIGAPEAEVWSIWYFTPPWMTAIDWMNSIPLFGAILLAGLLLNRWRPGHWRYVKLIVLFALAALTHILGDLPLHVEDGHAHFVPFSQWRFESPVSYWDPRYFGNITAPIELALGLAMIIILWRRCPNSVRAEVPSPSGGPRKGDWRRPPDWRWGQAFFTGQVDSPKMV